MKKLFLTLSLMLFAVTVAAQNWPSGGGCVDDCKSKSGETVTICSLDTQNRTACDYKVSSTNAGTRLTTTSGATVTGIIDTAIAALPTGGGTVLLKNGTYNLLDNVDGTRYLNASINIDSSDITLKCEKGALLIGNASTAGDVNTGINITADDSTVEGCIIDGGSPSVIDYMVISTGTTGTPLKNIKIINNEFRNGTDGYTSHYSQYVEVSGNYFHDMTGTGFGGAELAGCVEIESESKYIDVTDNFFNNCTIAITPHSHAADAPTLAMKHITVTGNVLVGDSTSNPADTIIKIANGEAWDDYPDGVTEDMVIDSNILINTYIRSEGPWNTIIVSNNTITDNPDTTYGAIHSDREVGRLTITGNDISGSAIAAILAHSDGTLRVHPSTGVENGVYAISNNIITGNVGALDVTGCSAVSVSGNTVVRNGAAGSNHGIDVSASGCEVVVSSNTVKDHGGTLVRIGDVVDRPVSVTGNTISDEIYDGDTFQPCLRLDNLSPSTVTGNTLSDCSYGIALDGAGPHYVSGNSSANSNQGDVWLTGSAVTAIFEGNNFLSTGDNGLNYTDLAHDVLFINNHFASTTASDPGTVASQPAIGMWNNSGMLQQFAVDFGACAGCIYVLGEGVSAGAIEQNTVNVQHITVDNCASGSCRLFIRKAVPGKIWYIENLDAADNITFRVSGQTGAAVTATKTGVFIGDDTDVNLIYEF